MAGTIYALSSGRPPAAISVIRISGPLAHAAGAAIAGSLPEARTAAVRELRHPRSGELLDQALILRFDSPASATGEDCVEFQCHGGRAVVDAVLSALAEVEGTRPALAGEFTRRAFENGRIDLTEAEGLADLIEAETEAQRKSALALAEGGLKKQIETWRQRLLGLSAKVERAIDYDDDDEAIDAVMLREAAALAAELDAWLERPRVEPLKDGVLVVVAGPPNAGKSSLINAIAGEDRVIVTDVPGTTRDHVEVPLSLGGIPIRLTDTAGLRDTEDAVEAIGIGRAALLVELADVLVWLGSRDEAPPRERLIVLHSKSDLSDHSIEDGVLPVSSVTHAGIPELLDRIQSIARSVLPSDDRLALNRRQAGHIADAADVLGRVAGTRDLVVIAEHLRAARAAFDRLTGRAGVEDVLDELFGRFCLGK